MTVPLETNATNVDNPLDSATLVRQYTGMGNTKRTKSTVNPADLWGTAEHAAWELKTYGPKPVQHPTGCSCSKCQAGYAWAKGYQEYIRRVHGR